MDWMREEEKRPDAKLYQILAGVALGLQAAAVALSVYIWADQRKVKELFSSTAEDGYIAIGYYANGSRNFYLKENVACTDPSVLKGKKIRSMPSSTSMDMIELMGGSPVPMAGGETYSALQQGIVDGAENTELVLTVDGHQDLVKAYTYTEHQYSPDIYIISTRTWNV